MTVPASEEYEPRADHGSCAGCAEPCPDAPARARTPRARGRGERTAHGARCALLLAAAAGIVLYAGGGAGAAATTAWATVKRPAQTGDTGPAEGATTPQGGQGPLHGKPAPGSAVALAPGLRLTTRAEIINRAKLWVAAKVPYSMTDFWSDGYRQDCSGYVSMAWNLPGNEWTGSLAQFGVRLDREDLQPGDILLFHNTADPAKGSHVTIFGGWTDYTHTHYVAYEQAKPHTRKQSTPMAYWSDSDAYVAYRYTGVIGASVSSHAPRPSAADAIAAYPGAALFRPGAVGEHIAEFGRLLRGRGAGALLGEDPGTRWNEAYRQATLAFQRAQGWSGPLADGLPGAGTWGLLVSGRGKDIAHGGTDAVTGAVTRAGTVTRAEPRGVGGAGTPAGGGGRSAVPGGVPVDGSPRVAPQDAEADRAGPQGQGSPTPARAGSPPAAVGSRPGGAAGSAVPPAGEGRVPPGGRATPAVPQDPASRAAPAVPPLAGRAVPQGHPAGQPARVPGHPEPASLRPGQTSPHIDALRGRLAQRGFGKHGTSHGTSRPTSQGTSAGLGQQWTEADRRDVQAFQRAQGWRDGAADGIPGPETWRRLFS
ncbi:peptidoglycan-binding protein [Streptomyces sp. SCSIO 30461]|uniref:peptidoglycan-binding protein n=1 Tax=Streptomyces sp. SCSIO 30461 TaxID=3118085 RepID=UPI0030D45FD4